MINFDGKTVLVTGGSRGIGAACVKMFAKQGAKVAFTYSSNKIAAQQLVDEIGSDKIKSYQFDLSVETDAAFLIKKITDEIGAVDILINNAGIWERCEADTMSIENWERTIKINLTGMYIFTKAVLPYMQRNKLGKIINVASTAGQRGEANYSHYAASKGGIISYTKSLASEFGMYNINTNCVAPGWVVTDMTVDVFSDIEFAEKVRKEIPVQRIATAEDIAAPILFLASEMARHINGEILNVNGGSILCG
ncbi:MAG: 3-oxoacyl-ACP reductase FabG [Ignavibacteriaceae bacterium]|nr:3-oxoacyl-ACP reductase FabG [Ignavibacteriaceae bacterium]